MRAATDERRREIGDALEAFAQNTIEHMLEERELLSGRIELPRFDTDFRDRPALIVVRGVDHQKDLRMLRPYIRDMKPAILAVDGGANAILEEGFKPDMIVGDMDSATERGAALRRRARRPRLPRRQGARPRATSRRSACPSRSSRRPARARTSRC